MTSPPGPPKLILLVEDDPDVLGVMRNRLESAGYAVLTSRTGQDAIETAQQAGVTLVLLDLGLPDMTGFEVLKRIHAAKAGLPVIIVTGCHEESEARKAFDFGAWDYITKPVDFDYLKNLLLNIQE